MTARDTSGNATVDFIWGNMPMQPDDDRASGHKLDAALGDHVIATTSYHGFPGDNAVAPFLDTVANVTVPDLLLSNEVDATRSLGAADLVLGTVTYLDNAAGATALNDGLVASSTPEYGASWNTGGAVDIEVYAYTAP